MSPKGPKIHVILPTFNTKPSIPARAENPDFQPDPERVFSEMENYWVDPRLPVQAKRVIVDYYPKMKSRTTNMCDYDACVQWMDVFDGNNLDVEMYQGNGDHYWLAVGSGIFDPCADKVAGFPDINQASYHAKKVIWKNNQRVDQDVLQET